MKLTSVAVAGMTLLQEGARECAIQGFVAAMVASHRGARALESWGEELKLASDEGAAAAGCKAATLRSCKAAALGSCRPCRMEGKRRRHPARVLRREETEGRDGRDGEEELRCSSFSCGTRGKIVRDEIRIAE